MKRKISIILAFLFIIISLASCVPNEIFINKANEKTVEEMYTDLYDLCYIKKQTHHYMQSGYDRVGGNGDHYPYSKSFDNPDYKNRVLVDVKGCGVVTSIGVSWLVLDERARLRFYFDGEETPRIDMSIAEMTDGTHSPFLYPFAMDNTLSSGTWTIYLPIPFEKSLRVEGDYIYYGHISYEMIYDNPNIKSYTSDMTYDEAKLALLNSDNYMPEPDCDKETNKTSLNGQNSGCELFSLNGSNIIEKFTLFIPKLSKALESGGAKDEKVKDILSNIRLQIYYNGSKTPSVDAPLGLFFLSSAYGGYENITYALGFMSDSLMYCNFPIPFEKSVKVMLYSESDEQLDDIESVFYYKEFDGNFSDVGYFSTQINEQKAQNGKPLTIFEDEGCGQLVGINQNIKANTADKGWYLEGDEYLYLDGSMTRFQTGTGTEELYHGGWYFNNGYIKHPLYGYFLYDRENTTEYISMYRLFIADSISYRNGIIFNIEHSTNNNSKYPPDYVFIAYYYKINNSSGTKLTDTISYKKYKITADNKEEYEIVSAGDIYDYSQVYITQEGIIADNSKAQVNAKISKNNRGVIIRRLLYSQIPVQTADVYVDGEFVGVWHVNMLQGYDSGIDAYYSDYIIPQKYTYGKSKIKIKFDSKPYQTQSSYFETQIYSIR